MTFTELDITPALITALRKESITEPTPIQEAATQLIMERKDVYLNAETGSGKTLAYLLPLFSKLNLELPATQLIVLLPTHELAIQIHRQCTALAQNSGLPIRSLLLIGGTSRDRQLDKLKKKPHVIVGSSGRILEFIQDGKVKTREVISVVVDEADKLLDGESLNDILGIIKSIPKKPQLIFASATQSQQPETQAVIASIAPELVLVAPQAAPVNPRIQHLYMMCEERKKTETLRKLIHALLPERAIVFVHKNDTSELLASKLNHHKIPTADLNGASHKEDRKRAMDDFKSGKVKVLIASDVAARGLDIKDVTHVFNFDTPTESKAYLHRVGRTARAGADGVAVTLVVGPQSRAIERFKDELSITLTEVYVREGEVRAMKT